MFPLKTEHFPRDAAELKGLLEESLRDLFDLARGRVELREKAYPHLETLNICLDGARLPERPPPIPTVNRPTEPALVVDRFRVEGAGMQVGPATVDFKLDARDLQLQQAADRDGRVVLLLLHNAAQGRIETSIATRDLEALIADVARREAAKHGVNIDGVQLSLKSRSPRSLSAQVDLRAKKLFISAALRITGQLDLDDQLVARISGLDCTGEGAIAGVACGVLKPHLQELDGREFPLMSLPLGEVRLSDVRIAVDEKLSVTAEFGSARE
jgi:hypothetical protein